MNPESTAATEAPALPEPPPARSDAPVPLAPRPERLPRIALAAALLALAAAAGQWWEARGRSDTLQSELAQRLAEGDTVAKESRIVARQAQEAVAALQAKVGALEARLGDSQSQQVALEAMYHELTRNRDDRVLAEVEQTVNLAVQQLQLAGNVEAALIALQSADARLARTEQAQFIPLRRALIQDIERLKALPLVDVPGLAIKLDGVVSAVDRMPLAFEGKPRGEAPPAAPAGGDFWARLAADLWRELSQLIRIERLDRPDPAVLSPQNAFILRENLKLRLINARLALLQRDSRTYREDLKQGQAWIERYFDLSARPAQDAVALLRELAGAQLRLELPTLDDSLTALRNFKLGRDKAATGR
jgi:uroporphyrin-3 C-methyltransferase